MSIKAAIDFFGNQSKLAKACGIKPQTVSRWMLGISKPSFKNIQRIVIATGGKVTKEQLLSDIYSDDNEELIQPTSEATTPP
jgi:DNA-binding transcriptional regulator YdaS (Cro superfamily)